jgi:cob(I)alamin adenosyltransferase
MASLRATRLTPADRNAPSAAVEVPAPRLQVNSKAILRETAPMGNRLSKIVTRTGDAGETGLGDGSRTGKDSLRIAAIGEVDETNSAIGLLLTEGLPDDLRDQLLVIQHDLFDLGGELCLPGQALIQPAQVAALEGVIEALNAELPRLKEFVLPGGTRAAATAHLARATSRRAERAVVALGHAETVSAAARQYLNRLSDLLFVIARTLNRRAGSGDVLWQKGRHQERG